MIWNLYTNGFEVEFSLLYYSQCLLTTFIKSKIYLYLISLLISDLSYLDSIATNLFQEFYHGKKDKQIIKPVRFGIVLYCRSKHCKFVLGKNHKVNL
jgi:hypothetical protein